MNKVLVCLAVAFLAAGCNDNGGGSPTDPSQVNIEFSFSDLVVGTGTEATPGRIATFANWELWLYNAAGTASKGTRIQGQEVGAISYTVGSSQLIPGFDQGIRGMKVGGKRRIYVPPSLAYGPSGSSNGAIPPNASIVFEVELTNVQ